MTATAPREATAQLATEAGPFSSDQSGLAMVLNAHCSAPPHETTPGRGVTGGCPLARGPGGETASHQRYCSTAGLTLGRDPSQAVLILQDRSNAVQASNQALTAITANRHILETPAQSPCDKRTSECPTGPPLNSGRATGDVTLGRLRFPRRRYRPNATYPLGSLAVAPHARPPSWAWTSPSVTAPSTRARS